MYNTGSSNHITQLYASIEEFDGDIDRLIDAWEVLYPSVKSQLETADELNLMNSFAEILLENGKLELATSVDENIQEVLESDAENDLDEWNRHRFYSLINGRWSGQANSPIATSPSDSRYGTAFSRGDEIPRSCTPIANPSLAQYNTAFSRRDEVPRSWAPKANPSPVVGPDPARKPGPGQLSQLSHRHFDPTPDPLGSVKSSEMTPNECSLLDQESLQHRSTTIQAGSITHENTSLAPLLGQSYEPSFGSKQYAP